MYKGCTCGDDKIDCIDCMKDYIAKCDETEKSIRNLASKWFAEMDELYEKYFDEDRNKWKVRQARDNHEILMSCREKMLTIIGQKFID